MKDEPFLMKLRPRGNTSSIDSTFDSSICKMKKLLHLRLLPSLEFISIY